MSISEFLLEKSAVIFKTRLSLKEEAKCPLIHDSAKMQLGVGGWGRVVTSPVDCRDRYSASISKAPSTSYGRNTRPLRCH